MRFLAKNMLVFSLLFLFSICLFNIDKISAAEVASGKCGEKLTWVLDDEGTLQIEGTGIIESNYWAEYTREITKVVIGDGVTGIESMVFSYFTNLTEVVIPSSVDAIAQWAFKGCESMTHIYIPSSVRKISATSEKMSPFNGCPGLAVYTDCNSRNSGWDVYAFLCIGKVNYGYTRDEYDFWKSLDKTMTSIDIPDFCTKIPYEAFDGNNYLTKVTIPDGVTYIDSYAFRNCTELTEILLPDSVVSTGQYVFQHCDKLKKVKLSNKMTEIKKDEFWYCDSLESVVIPDSITSIGNNAFRYRIIESEKKLKYIFYGGTSAQWNSILIESGNDDLIRLPIHFSATEHSWNSDYTVDAESTCAAAGSKSIHCSICDAVKDDSAVEIMMAEHKWNPDYTIDVEATCKTVGSKSIHCSVCRDAINTDSITEIPLKDHIVELKNREEATYTSTGYTGDEVCTVCGEIIKSGTVIPIKERVEATGKFAILKSILLQRGQTDSYGDKYFETVCDSKDNLKSVVRITYRSEESAFLFSYTSYKNNKETGSIVFFMDENGSEYVTVYLSNELLSLFASAMFNVADYTQDGQVYFEKMASHILENSEIQEYCNSVLKSAFLGWDILFLENFALDINMADMGFVSYEEAGTHTWDSGIVTKEATSTSEGVRTYTCLVCGATETETIPKLTGSSDDTKLTGNEGNNSNSSSNSTSEDNGIMSRHKISQKVKVTAKKKFTAKKLKKKAQSFKLSAKSSSGRKVKYKLVKKNKHIKFTAASGKVTVKKGTKKGKYIIKVRMSVSGNNIYNACVFTKTITIKVK